MCILKHKTLRFRYFIMGNFMIWSRIPIIHHIYPHGRAAWWRHQMETFSALLAFWKYNIEIGRLASKSN